MIDFRYHLVSTVAVFLALAVGVVLGATLLGAPLVSGPENQKPVSAKTAPDTGRPGVLAARVHEGDQQVVDAYAAEMTADRLSGARVLVLEAPGTDPAARKDAAARITAAGGKVTGTLALTDKFVDPRQKTFVGELADHLSPKASGAVGDSYDRVGGLLAAELLAPGESEPESDGASADRRAAAATAPSPSASGGARAKKTDGASALSGFSDGGLVSGAAPSAPADIALLLAPAKPLPDARGNAALLALARAMSAASGAAVLAGDTGAAENGGLLARARSEESGLSTVDTLGTATGSVVTVLALAEGLEARGGHYGVGEGASRALPDPVPGPRDSERGASAAEAASDSDADTDDRR